MWCLCLIQQKTAAYQTYSFNSHVTGRTNIRPNRFGRATSGGAALVKYGGAGGTPIEVSAKPSKLRSVNVSIYSVHLNNQPLMKVLSDELGATAFLEFATNEWAAENVLFIRAVDEFRASDSVDGAVRIFQTFIARPNAPLQINLSSDAYHDIAHNLAPYLQTAGATGTGTAAAGNLLSPPTQALTIKSATPKAGAKQNRRTLQSGQTLSALAGVANAATPTATTAVESSPVTPPAPMKQSLIDADANVSLPLPPTAGSVASAPSPKLPPSRSPQHKARSMTEQPPLALSIPMNAVPVISVTAAPPPVDVGTPAVKRIGTGTGPAGSTDLSIAVPPSPTGGAAAAPGGGETKRNADTAGAIGGGVDTSMIRMANLFDAAQREVFLMVQNDSFGRFKRTAAGIALRHLWEAPPLVVTVATKPVHTTAGNPISPTAGGGAKGSAGAGADSASPTAAMAAGTGRFPPPAAR